MRSARIRAAVRVEGTALAWNVVRLWSTTAAVAMPVVAVVLLPVTVLIANWGEDH